MSTASASGIFSRSSGGQRAEEVPRRGQELVAGQDGQQRTPTGTPDRSQVPERGFAQRRSAPQRAAAAARQTTGVSKAESMPPARARGVSSDHSAMPHSVRW